MKRQVWFVARALALGAVLVVLGTSAHAAECRQTSVGLVPLTTLGAATYNGMSGGLYAGGENRPPRAHADRGRVAAARIVPRLADGSPHHTGRVVLISIGMSNTSQEFATFRDLVRRDGRLSRALVVVNGAQGGMTASDWANASGATWAELERRLAAAGVTREQVQVVWLKLANRAGGLLSDTYRVQLERDSLDVLRILRDRLPNSQIVYLSSRIYAGYASSLLNPEPYAYESAFVVKNIIQRQVEGRPPAMVVVGTVPLGGRSHRPRRRSHVGVQRFRLRRYTPVRGGSCQGCQPAAAFLRDGRDRARMVP